MLKMSTLKFYQNYKILLLKRQSLSFDENISKKNTQKNVNFSFEKNNITNKIPKSALSLVTYVYSVNAKKFILITNHKIDKKNSLSI